MQRKHGGLLMLQITEPKKLVGSMMSIVTETGEDWIHFVFSNEPQTFALSDDGRESTLLLDRTLAMSLLGLLRVAGAQFAMLHGDSTECTVTEHAEPSGADDPIRIEASRKTLSVVWPSAAEGVRRMDVDGQIELQLRSSFGASLERTLLESFARTAAGTPRA